MPHVLHPFCLNMLKNCPCCLQQMTVMRAWTPWQEKNILHFLIVPLLCQLTPDKPCWWTSCDGGWHLPNVFQFILICSKCWRSSGLFVKQYTHTSQVYRDFQSKPPSFVSGFLVFGNKSEFLCNFAGKTNECIPFKKIKLKGFK